MDLVRFDSSPPPTAAVPPVTFIPTLRCRLLHSTLCVSDLDPSPRWATLLPTCRHELLRVIRACGWTKLRPEFMRQAMNSSAHNRHALYFASMAREFFCLRTRQQQRNSSSPAPLFPLFLAAGSCAQQQLDIEQAETSSLFLSCSSCSGICVSCFLSG